jgi:hypothetical protein
MAIYEVISENGQRSDMDCYVKELEQKNAQLLSEIKELKILIGVVDEYSVLRGLESDLRAKVEEMTRDVREDIKVLKTKI